jgi:hypothetical protein
VGSANGSVYFLSICCFSGSYVSINIESNTKEDYCSIYSSGGYIASYSLDSFRISALSSFIYA